MPDLRRLYLLDGIHVPKHAQLARERRDDSLEFLLRQAQRDESDAPPMATVGVRRPLEPGTEGGGELGVCGHVERKPYLIQVRAAPLMDGCRAVPEVGHVHRGVPHYDVEGLAESVALYVGQR